jgi:hypothetical protein
LVGGSVDLDLLSLFPQIGIRIIRESEVESSRASTMEDKKNSSRVLDAFREEDPVKR